MPRRRPDLDLRRLVARLAAATPEDVEAILGALEPEQRRSVVSLLEAYAGGEAPKPKPRRPRPPPAEGPPRIPGLSPWLAVRLRQGQGDSPKGPRRVLGNPGALAAMTPAALQALRTCAAKIQPPGKPQSQLARLRAVLLRPVVAR